MVWTKKKNSQKKTPTKKHSTMFILIHFFIVLLYMFSLIYKFLDTDTDLILDILTPLYRFSVEQNNRRIKIQKKNTKSRKK